MAEFFENGKFLAKIGCFLAKNSRIFG